MKMNIGSVSSGYHFISFMAAENPRSDPPTPHNGMRRRHRDEADRAEHALTGYHHQHHRAEHQDGDHVVGHQMSSPRIFATSRKKKAMAWSSIRNTPTHITILIGAI